MNKLISTISVSIIMFVIVAVSYGSAWSATYYVDATNGNDSNGGTTISVPWKTIAKVNAAIYKPGDQILLKRGATWREQLIVPSSGTAGYPITFGAYGTGNPPKILGSLSKKQTSDWVLDTGNIWKIAATIPGDVGNIIFNNEVSAGIKVNTEAELTSQSKFWYDSTNQIVKMYSSGNPATYYSDIEVAYNLGSSGLIRLINRNYITIQNLDFRDSGNFGIVAAGTSNILIEHCNFKYIGGQSQGGVRLGNGIEFFDSNHDTIVRYCRLDQIYDAALTTQGTTPGNKKYNQYFYYNIISNSEYSFEFWNRDSTSTTDNIRFENNTCVNAGGGFGHSQRPDPSGVDVMFYSNTAATTNLYIRNNIFYNATKYAISLGSTAFNGLAGVVIDYNDYYKASGNLFKWGTNIYGVSQFLNYKTNSGKDAHSINLDPRLVNPIGNKFSLSSGSPCIGSGTNTGLTSDFLGNQLVLGQPFDIGAEIYTKLLSAPSNLSIVSL